MSQHDFDITTADANTGPSMRAAINAALQALAGNSSGATAPATTYPYQMWADITADRLKIRNAANTAWIELAVLSAGIILPDDSVTSAKIAADAVGTSEIANDAVTSDKIAASAVGTTEIASASVTQAKLASDVLVPKAIVNFNGSTGTIRSSYNVSSVTRVGSRDGEYEITMTNALADANYTVLVSGSPNFAGSRLGAILLHCGTDATYPSEVTPTTTKFSFMTLTLSGDRINSKYVSVVVY